jgi:hypothetical protein
MNEKGGYDDMTFTDAVNNCTKFNATLVELQSQQKQSIFESFMREIGEPFNTNSTTYDRLNAFWINAHRDSLGRFIWINSGNQFTYTNWDPTHHEPNNSSGYDYVVVSVWNNDWFGKWFTDPKDETWVHAICEL